MGILLSCFVTRRRGLDYIDSTLENIRNARSLLEQKIEVLDLRYVQLRNEAKENAKRSLRQVALVKLHHAKLSQSQAKRAAAYTYRLSELYNHIENGLTTLAMADTMRQARDTIVVLNQQINVGEIEDMLDEIKEGIQQLQDATQQLSAPDRFDPNQYDEDELERELAALATEQADEAAAFPNVPDSAISGLPNVGDDHAAREPVAI